MAREQSFGGDPELQRELFELRQRLGLLPPAEQLHLTLDGNPMASWVVGIGDARKWLGVRRPPSANGAAGYITKAFEAYKDTPLVSGGDWEIKTPRLGWSGMTEEGQGVSAIIDDYHPGTLSDGCTPSSQPPLVDDGWEIRRGPVYFTVANCGPWYSHGELPFFKFDLLKPDGSTGGTVLDYTGQSATEQPIESWTSPVPGNWEAFLEAVENELVDHPSHYPVLTRFYATEVPPPTPTELLERHAPNLITDRDDAYRADSPGMHANSPYTQLELNGGSGTPTSPLLDSLDATYRGTGVADENDA